MAKQASLERTISLATALPLMSLGTFEVINKVYKCSEEAFLFVREIMEPMSWFDSRGLEQFVEYAPSPAVRGLILGGATKVINAVQERYLQRASGEDHLDDLSSYLNDSFQSLLDFSHGEQGFYRGYEEHYKRKLESTRGIVDASRREVEEIESKKGEYLEKNAQEQEKDNQNGKNSPMNRLLNFMLFKN